MTLALDGGTAAITAEWPAWPPALDDNQRSKLAGVIESGHLGSTSGPLCDEFADAFAHRHDTTHGVMCVNGTVALFAALRAAGVGPGDEVIIPTYTFVACATSVILLGATPVIVDVESDDLHMSRETIEEALSERTKAIMVVHIAGSACDMDPIMDLAAERDLFVVEDSAQAHGATYRSRSVGSLGHASTFSFQSSKAMTAGEGGIVCTSDQGLADRVWSACNVGRSREGAWYGHPTVGWNFRMTELQAAVLLPWLPRLDEEIAHRNAFAATFAQRLEELGTDARICPDPDGAEVNTRHLLMVRLGRDDGSVFDRKWINDALAAEGLPVDYGYPGLAVMDSVIAGGGKPMPTPRFDAVAERTLWIRQSMMMADPDRAVQAANVFHKVLGDPRSRR